MNQKVRTIPEGGYLTAGTNTVIQHPGVTYVLVPANAFRDNYFMVMNMTSEAIAVRVENDAFPIDYSGTECHSAVIPAWAQAYIAVTFDPMRDSRVAQIAGFISDTNGSTPSGDYLPKIDPVFDGTLKNADGTFSINGSNLKAAVSVATINAGMSIAIYAGSSRLSMSPGAITFSKTPEIGGPGNLADKGVFAILTRKQIEELIDLKKESGDYLTVADPEFTGSLSIKGGEQFISASAIDLRVTDSVKIGSSRTMVGYFSGENAIVGLDAGTSNVWLRATGTNAIQGATVSLVATGVVNVSGSRMSVSCTSVDFASNPTISGSVATAELSDIALVSKGQALEVSQGETIVVKKDGRSAIGESTGATYIVAEDGDLRVSGNARWDINFRIINDSPQIVTLGGDRLRTLYTPATAVGGGINLQPGSVWEFRTYLDGGNTKCVGWPVYSDINLG